MTTSTVSTVVPVRIGIAVVENSARYLVGIRPEGSELAGCSEFPGGKCGIDEASDRCAVRECFEETGLVVTADELLLQRVFHYPHGTFDLSFWLCRPAKKSDVGISHSGFRWVTKQELATLIFPGGNAPVIELLNRRSELQDNTVAESADG